MAQLKAKPVILEGYLWNGDLADLPFDWQQDGPFARKPNGDLVVHTNKGPATAEVGKDWLIRGTQGEFYPIPLNVCRDKYTAVGS